MSAGEGEPFSCQQPTPFTMHFGLEDLLVAKIGPLVRGIHSRKLRKAIINEAWNGAEAKASPNNAVPSLLAVLRRKWQDERRPRIREQIDQARRSLYQPSVEFVNAFSAQRAAFESHVDLTLKQFGRRRWLFRFGENPLQPQSQPTGTWERTLTVGFLWREWFDSPAWWALDVSFDGTVVTATFSVGEHTKVTNTATLAG